MATSMEHRSHKHPPTIKGLQWKLLFSNHRRDLGEGGWQALAQATGAPTDVKDLPLEADVPVGPFNDALAYLDQALGDGDGATVDEIAVASVKRWATMYQTLVAELEGRPVRMLEVFCDEVHPWFVNDDGAAEVLSAGRDHAVVRLDGHLHPGFRQGLVEGVVGLTGVQASAEVIDDGVIRVAWDPIDTPERSFPHLFFKATRAQFLGFTLVPILLGTALAWWQGTADLVTLGLATAGAVSLHLSANVFNDVVDHVRGIDPANLTPTPFSGGSRALQIGLLGLGEMVALAGVLGAAGIGMGLWLVTVGGPWVLALGVVGVALGYAYSGAPFTLARRGLGEATVVGVFGPLLTAGAYVVQTGTLTPGALFVGLPVGLLTAAVVYTGELPDVPWDARTGRRTLAVRLGDQAPWGLAIILALAYATLAGLITAGVVPLATAAALATVPLAVLVARGVARCWQDPEALVPYQAGCLVLQAVTGALMVGGLLFEVWL